MNKKLFAKLINDDSRKLSKIPSNSIDLVVTSPPYPMIKMWDGLFDGLAQKDISKLPCNEMFEAQHKELDKVWKQLKRVVKVGGFVCINIGDATRKLNGEFQMYWNASRVILAMTKLGFINLPQIIWRKVSNSPNKFMGSGTLPAGAYVTLEYEHILIFRKISSRKFDKMGSDIRQTSSIFFEERNTWYSAFWNLAGVSQIIREKNVRRNRSAAFPFELAYRLINMYSMQGDTVLDPFLGTGTTMQAAISSGRKSIGVEIDESFNEIIWKRLIQNYDYYNQFSKKRLSDHREFIKNNKEKYKHKNLKYNFHVVSSQEKKIELPIIKDIEFLKDENSLYFSI